MDTRASAKEPSPKDVVLTLMSSVGPPETAEKTKKDGTKEYVLKYGYVCPKPGCKHISKREATAGFTNPFDHLKKCYGSKKGVYDLYNEAVKKAAVGGGSVLSHFQASASSP